MENVITRSKFVNETIPIVFDFSDQLSSGESVSSCTITVSLFTGIDNNPSNILYHTPIITGNVVEQNVRLGIPGCIYEISFLAIGSSGTHCEKCTNLAILPQVGNAIPNYTWVWLNTYYYPYEYAEGLVPHITLIGGNTLLNPSWTESLSPTIQLIAGSLFGGQVTYSIPFDSLAPSVSLINGSLFGGEVDYSIPAEGLECFVALLSGSLFGGEIDYNIPAEGLIPSITLISGTLT